jgi:integrase
MRLYADPTSPFIFYDFSYRGKRYRGSTGEKTQRAAMMAATAFRDRLAAGDPSTRSRSHVPTLQEFAKEFLDWAEQASSLDENTKRYYTYGARLLGFCELACVPIDQIDARLIDTTKFERPLIDRKTGKATAEWVSCSKSYTQQAQRTLRVMLGKAVEWGALATRVSFPIGKTPGRDKLITPEIEQAILKGLSEQRSRVAWVVMITLIDSGCRPSEVFAMRQENIDWAGRRIFISEGKTPAARRWVGMTERMHRELSGWCQGAQEPGWLFPARRRNTKVGHLGSISKCFRAACTRAGLDRSLVPYLARHTFGTTTLGETGNQFAVMKAMGHSSVQSMGPYQHHEISQVVEVMNRRSESIPGTRSRQE